MGAKVWFLGGGPGASDLLTLRAAKVLGKADVVIWGQPLLSEKTVREYARAEAELVPWPPATMADIYAVYDRAVRDDLVVARLSWGDPALYGGVRAEAHEARSRGLEVEVVPGVSSLGAAAAVLCTELTQAPNDPPPLILAAPQDDPPPSGSATWHPTAQRGRSSWRQARRAAAGRAARGRFSSGYTLRRGPPRDLAGRGCPDVPPRAARGDDEGARARASHDGAGRPGARG